MTLLNVSHKQYLKIILQSVTSCPLILLDHFLILVSIFRKNKVPLPFSMQDKLSLLLLAFVLFSTLDNVVKVRASGDYGGIIEDVLGEIDLSDLPTSELNALMAAVTPTPTGSPGFLSAKGG